MEDKFNYIEEANVTMSDGFHCELVSHEFLMMQLNDFIEIVDNLDRIKKTLFYGRALPEVMAQGDSHLRRNDIQVVGLHDNPHDGIRLLHGIIGIITEAGELAYALREGLQGRKIDNINLGEEVGDIQWYAAAILRVLGTNFDKVQRTNIAKLRARFPDKFNEHDANNRNLDAERVILESDNA